MSELMCTYVSGGYAQKKHWRMQLAPPMQWLLTSMTGLLYPHIHMPPQSLQLSMKLCFNLNFWQIGQERLLNGFLSCRQRNACVSCQIHDNDNIAGHFTMNAIPWACNVGQASANLPNHVLQWQILTSSGATVAQRLFVLQTKECLCVLSDTWQWFSTRTFHNECYSLGVQQRTTSNLPDLWLQWQLLTSARATAAQWLLSCKQRNAWLSCQIATWQLFSIRTFHNECYSFGFNREIMSNLPNLGLQY